MKNIPRVIISKDKEKIKRQIDALEWLLRTDIPEKDRIIHTQGLKDLKAALKKGI